MDEERRRHAGCCWALCRELRLCSSGGELTGMARARTSNPSVDRLMTEEQEVRCGSVDAAGTLKRRPGPEQQMLKVQMCVGI